MENMFTFNDPLGDLNRKIQKNIASLDIYSSSIGEMLKKMSPMLEIGNKAPMFVQPEWLDFSDKIQTPIFSKPAILTITEGILKDIHEPYKMFSDILVPKIPDYSKMLNEGIWHSIRRNENIIKDFSTIGSTFTNLHDISNSIENMYSPIQNVLAANSFLQLGKDLQFKFPKGLIDFSSNDIVKKSFSDISILLTEILKENNFFDEDHDSISINDNLNIALNADYEDYALDNSALPVYVLDEYLQKWQLFLKNIREQGESVYQAATLAFENKSALACFFMFFLQTVVGVEFEDGYRNLKKIFDTSPHQEQTVSGITVTETKVLKEAPNELSASIGELQPNTTIEIKEDGGSWIKVSFVDEYGKYHEGWIENNNLKNAIL